MTTRIQEIDNENDVLQALLWQYSNSKKIFSLIEQKQIYLNAAYSDFWDSWYDDVFNLLTANEFGLAVWSIILGIPLFIPLENIEGKWFGFNSVPISPVGNPFVNFNRGNFPPVTPVYSLTLEEQRLILRLRYYQLVSNGVMVNDGDANVQVPGTNNFLQTLFPASLYPPILTEYGTVYALDNLDMSITYVFNIAISDNLINVLQDFDLLPRPAGVKIKYRILSGAIFGFNNYSGSIPINTFTNFGNGALAPPE